MAQIIQLAKHDPAMTEESIPERVRAVEAELDHVKDDVRSVKESVKTLDDKLNDRMTGLEATQKSNHDENTKRLSGIQTTLDFQAGERSANQRHSAFIGRVISGAIGALVSGVGTYFITGHH